MFALSISRSKTPWSNIRLSLIDWIFLNSNSYTLKSQMGNLNLILTKFQQIVFLPYYQDHVGIVGTLVFSLKIYR